MKRDLMRYSHGGGQEGLHTIAHGRRTIQGPCKTEPNSDEEAGHYQRDGRKIGSVKKQEKHSPCPQDAYRTRKETEVETRAEAPHWAHWTIFHVNWSQEAELHPQEHSWDRVTQIRHVSGDNCFWQSATSQQPCQPRAGLRMCSTSQCPTSEVHGPHPVIAQPRGPQSYHLHQDP